MPVELDDNVLCDSIIAGDDVIAEDNCTDVIAEDHPTLQF